MKSRKPKPRKSPPRYHFSRGKRTWRRKFSDAFSGLRESFRRQSSYHAHFAATVLVVLSAWFLGNFDAVRWSLLVLCIVVVLGAEMFNTSIEALARAVTTSYNPHIGRALNIASGAVLTLAGGAAVVGILLFSESILRLYRSS